MDHCDRMHATRKIGERIANKIIKRLLTIKEEEQQIETDLTLRLAQLIKLMDEFDNNG